MKSMNFETWQKIGLNLLFYRRQRNMTQMELAEKCGISRNYIQRIETAASSCTLDTVSYTHLQPGGGGLGAQTPAGIGIQPLGRLPGVKRMPVGLFSIHVTGHSFLLSIIRRMVIAGNDHSYIICSNARG